LLPGHLPPGRCFDQSELRATCRDRRGLIAPGFFTVSCNSYVVLLVFQDACGQGGNGLSSPILTVPDRSTTYINALNADMQVTVELKNDLAIQGTLHSVDQYLNIKLHNTRVVNEQKYPHMVSVSRQCCHHMCIKTPSLARLGCLIEDWNCAADVSPKLFHQGVCCQICTGAHGTAVVQQTQYKYLYCI